jgi:hypothetical protein
MWSRKKENNTWGSFIHEHKRNMLNVFLTILIFKKVLNNHFPICSIVNGLKEP